MEKWYEVIYRAPAELTVYVLADSPESARQRAEDGNYESEGDIAFLKNKHYTMKVRRANPEVAAMREP